MTCRAVAPLSHGSHPFHKTRGAIAGGRQWAPSLHSPSAFCAPCRCAGCFAGLQPEQQAHNLKVVCSNPTPAIKNTKQPQNVTIHPRVDFCVGDLSGATLMLQNRRWEARAVLRNTTRRKEEGKPDLRCAPHQRRLSADSHLCKVMRTALRCCSRKLYTLQRSFLEADNVVMNKLKLAVWSKRSLAKAPSDKQRPRGLATSMSNNIDLLQRYEKCQPQF
jgi:hypothetical protein